MTATYPPLVGIEIVGAATEVLDKTQGHVTIGDKHESTRCVGRERYGLAVQVAQGIVIGKFTSGKDLGAERGTHGQVMCGEDITPLQLGERDTRLNEVELLGESRVDLLHISR